MVPNRELVPLAVVAKKWRRPEDELFDWALQKKFYVYYYLQQWGWRVVLGELGCFLRGDDGVTLTWSDLSFPTRFPIRPMNPMVPFTANNHLPVDFTPFSPLDPIIPIAAANNSCCLYLLPGSFENFISSPTLPIPSVTVNRSDLFLHHDEIADMEARYPELAREETKIKTNSRPEQPNNTRKTDARKESSHTRIADVPVDFLPSKNDAESVSPIPARIKQQKLDQHIVEVVAEPLLQDKDDSNLPLKTQTDTVERYLRIWDIVGDEKRGIRAIIPVKSTTWWNGVRSGRFPKSYKLGKRCTAWKASDIYALLKKMEQGAA